MSSMTELNCAVMCNLINTHTHTHTHTQSTPSQEEMAKEAEVGRGKGKGGMILRGPAPTAQELSFLVVYVFSAQDLPNYSTLGVPSIAGFVQVGEIIRMLPY